MKMMFEINDKILKKAFTLNEFDGIPIVFVCTDDDFNVYLCLCTEIRHFQRWIIKRSSCNEIENLMFQVNDLHSFVKEGQKVFIAETTDNYNGIEYTEILSNDISPLDLPDKGVFLDYINEDSFQELDKLRKRIIAFKYASCIERQKTKMSQTLVNRFFIYKTNFANINDSNFIEYFNVAMKTMINKKINIDYVLDEVEPICVIEYKSPDDNYEAA